MADRRLEAIVLLALADAKQAQRDIRMAVKNLAQARDYIEDNNVQSERDTTNDSSTDRHS
jgi:hypothetical protein